MWNIVSDSTLTESYRRLGSVWRVGKEVGLSGQNVHKRLSELGIKMEGAGRRFTQEDADFLKENYHRYRDAFMLDELADEMGRTKHFLCRKARSLGLTDRSKKYSCGFKNVTQEGYVNVGHQGHEHVAVMEKHLDRKMRKGEVVHHKDGNKKNNNIENLEVMTRSEHFSLHSRGERSVNAKLTDKKVLRIRSYFEAGILRSELAKTFNVSWTVIDRVVKNRGWTHI